MSVLLLATYDSKEEEAAYLERAMGRLGVPCERIDLSLRSGGAQWSASGKLEGMGRAAARAIEEIAFRPRSGRHMVVAIGGGTGGQIALEVLRALPIEMPKLLVSTLPFDPRHALADNAIVLVPTVADLAGLNATVRQALDRAAAIAFGLWSAELPQRRVATAPSVGLTALGVTAGGVDAAVRRLRALGHETTVFHANGFGGAAFARWCRAGAFSAVIDYTTHELTRLHVAGIHVEMPDRFTVAGALPRVVVPGGVNFVGMGEPHLMPEAMRARPHYRHSPLFTHVKVTEEEARRLRRHPRRCAGRRHGSLRGPRADGGLLLGGPPRWGHRGPRAAPRLRRRAGGRAAAAHPRPPPALARQRYPLRGSGGRGPRRPHPEGARMTIDPGEIEARSDALIAAARRCFERGLQTNAGGNLSVRLASAEAVVIKPSGVGFAEVTRDNLQLAWLDGRVEPSAHKPSKDLDFHLAIYRLRPRCRRDRPLPQPLGHRLGLRGARDPLLHRADHREDRAAAADPALALGGPQTEAEIGPVFADPSVRAAVLANHGTVGVGPTLARALHLAEIVEETAHVAFVRATR